MRRQRILGWALLGLVLLFAVQFGAAYRLHSPNRTIVHASWAQSPHSMAELMGDAEDVVKARVMRVRESAIQVRAPGEPGGAERVPVEVVTMQVQHRYSEQRGRPRTIQVFHTGLAVGTPPWKKPDRPPSRPPAAMQEPTMKVDKSAAAARPVLLEGDPPYRQGEEYVLALRKGPPVLVGGQKVSTMRPVSPEGRFRISSGGQVQPVLLRQEFVRRLRGHSLQALEHAVQKGLAHAVKRRPAWKRSGS